MKVEDQKAALEALRSKNNNLSRDAENSKKEISILTEQLSTAKKVNDDIESKKKDATKQSSDYVKANKKLDDDLFDLERKYEDILSKYEKAESVKSELAGFLEQQEEIASTLQFECDTSRNENIQLKQDLDEAKIQLERLQIDIRNTSDDQSEWKKTVEDLKSSHEADIVKMKLESKVSADKIVSLEAKITDLKNNTLVGEKQKQIDILSIKEAENKNKISELQNALLQADSDLETLKKKVATDDKQIEFRVAEKSASVREETKDLRMKLEDMKRDRQEDNERHASMEKDNERYLKEIEDLKRMNDLYEKGLGDQENAKLRKKLEKDIYRMEGELEKVKRDLDLAKDEATIWSQSFTKLKTESGKHPDFRYPEYELRDDLISQQSKMSATVHVMEKQISDLERENSDLRTTMRQQFATIGEQGFRYANMTPEQIYKVNEFANNLRDGKVVLPVSDTSRELIAENERLKEKLQERSNVQSTPVYTDKNSASPSALTYNNKVNDISSREVLNLREDMLRISHENAELQERLSTMQSELMSVIKQTISQKDAIDAKRASPDKRLTVDDSSKQSQFRSSSEVRNSNDDLAAMLLAHNENLLRELQDLKSYSTNIIKSTQNQSRVLQIENQAGIADKKAKKNSDTLSLPEISMQTPAHKHREPTATPANAYAQQGWTPMVGPQMGVPTTPHGRQLLANNLAQLNLPPEEWAHEVKELHAQLVECIEQLYEREEELQSQRSVVSGLEDNLIAIKQQLAALYTDFAQRADSWDSREKEYKDHNNELVLERDNLRIKVQRYEQAVNQMKADNPNSVESKLNDLNRKLTIHEVNENILSRKFVSQNEKIQADDETRGNLERDFAEMEATLKTRILYLEQYKSSVSCRLAFIQAKLDTSVPEEDFVAVNAELQSLREDHLNTLRREVEGRIFSLKSQDQARELRSLRVSEISMQTELQAAKSTISSLIAQLEKEKELTKKAATTDTSKIVSEMAKYRGEASRLEVELESSQKKCENYSYEIKRLNLEIDELSSHSLELQKREVESATKEENARKGYSELKLKYDGGLPKDQVATLKEALEKANRDLEEALRESSRHKEMAEIASMQAQAVRSYRDQHEEEVKALREHALKLESRSDDDVLIGKLQRQLMSTKTSYKAFVRKYENIRNNMRKRELAMRIVETKLDEKEKFIVDLKDRHQIEVAVLKKALFNIENFIDPEIDAQANPSQPKHKKDIRTKKQGGLLTTVGQKIVDMSSKVGHLSTMAEHAMIKATEALDESFRLQGYAEDLKTEHELMKQRCEDLQSIVDSNNKQVSSRLVALSDDVRANKLAVLQQKRQILLLTKEKRHLQGIIKAIEGDVEGLEQAKVWAETNNMLGDPDENILKSKDKINQIDIKETAEYARLVRLSEPADRVSKLSVQFASASESKDPDYKVESFDFSSGGDNQVEELIEKHNLVQKQFTQCRRDLNEVRLKNDGLYSHVAELQTLLKERDAQLAQMDKIISKDGKSVKTPRGASDDQEISHLKISSLVSLLDERNRMIEKLQHKLEDSKSERKVKSNADRKADEILEKLNMDINKRGNVSNDVPFDEFQQSATYQNRLAEQVKQADDLLIDKERMVTQLEQKLLVQGNKLERAETRCGTALKEMEAMKTDMLTLAKQLQASEERCNVILKSSVKGVAVPAAATDVDSDERIQRLEKSAKAKDEKLKGYREIILRLKEEFIKSEEEKALASIANNTSRAAKDTSFVQPLGAEEVRELKKQILAVRDDLKQAKDDLERARKMREKLTQARQAAQEEAQRMETQLGRAEAQASLAQDQLNRVRKELEEAHRKEVQLRDKLKDALEGQPVAQITGERVANRDGNSTSEKLEREVEILRAQNLALRRTAETKDAKELYVEKKDSNATVKFPDQKSANDVFSASKGNVLGGDNDGGGTKDELRQQLHTKWESEKRLQKRVLTLEKRLQEKIDEADDLQEQLKRSRETTSQAIAAKEKTQKEASNAIKQTVETKQFGADDVASLNDANNKIFTLEEQNMILRRKVEVELATEIVTLRHQLSAARGREEELKGDLQESESLRKKASSGGRSLRDSEDKFVREERLKEELVRARQQRMELEAALLDRDSRAMGGRFDLEASVQEVDRLKRRNKELESAYKHMSIAANHNKDGKSNVKSAWADKDALLGAKTNSSNREKDLEGVVEAMKRVVDKLKVENDRLRKGGGTDEKKAASGTLDKKFSDEKKKSEQLEADVKALTSKVKMLEEGNAKLTQRTQQSTTMRKQLKSREDELSTIRDRTESLMEERDNLQKRLTASDNRIAQLEMSLQQVSMKGGKGGADTSSKEVADMRKRVTEQAITIENLKSQLADSQKASRQVGSGDGSEEVARLRSENKKLRDELAAFDLSFFDEIENLKYAHAEAIKKLKVYEAEMMQREKRR